MVELVAILITWYVAKLITVSYIFDGFRKTAAKISGTLSYFVTCHMCVATWVALGVAFWLHSRFDVVASWLLYAAGAHVLYRVDERMER